MYDIEMHEPTADFVQCWLAAAKHLDRVGDGSLSWMKSRPTPPFLDHMSFRIGNQLFFVRVVDVSGELEVPGGLEGLRHIAESSGGVPCLMPMRASAGNWSPASSGWGLVHADSQLPMDPLSCVTDEKTIMTDWELQDFAVQITRDYIVEELGGDLMSTNSNPEVDPSIWFAGNEGPEWVVVRAVRYPANPAALPYNLSDIAKNCARLSDKGHFASLEVANAENSFEHNDVDNTLPLWRGHKLLVAFDGLVPAMTH
jgi:hypothetical protein